MATPKQDGFTLIELLVVISIIALLMAILMPALSRARKQARMVACQANLKQWGTIWSMYAEDHDGSFSNGVFPGKPVGWGERAQWLYALVPYGDTKGKIRFCPAAMRIPPEGTQTKSLDPSICWRWKWDEWDELGSYGMNSWAYNPPPERTHLQGRTSDIHWRKATQRNASRIPLFGDNRWPGAGPQDTDPPPPSAESIEATGEMKYWCMDRHENGTTNLVFLDFTVRRVGLKELWTLKWHKLFNTANAFTLAGGAQAALDGGAQAENWPEWMRGFKDY
jgi:prepilin-type N-terminal cleavage/methylation domain-containing protein